MVIALVTIATALVLTTVSVALLPTGNATGILSDAAMEELSAKVEAVGGCNANVCFAIDGGDSISPEAFANQKKFVLDVIALLADNPVEVAAVQYGKHVNRITRLTPDLVEFMSALDSEEQIGGLSMVRSGLIACIQSLRRRKGESLKIVLLGNANSYSRFRRAARVANRVRQRGGEVCTVGAGMANFERLLAIAGGDPNAVFDVNSFLDVLSLESIIEGLALNICGLQTE